MNWLDAVDEFLLNASQHEFLLVVYGIVLYFSLWFTIFKDEADSRDDPFPFWTWLRKNKDNIWTAFLVGLLTIVFDDEILGILGFEDETHHSLIYLAGGPLADQLRFWVVRLNKHRHHEIRKNHKGDRS